MHLTLSEGFPENHLLNKYTTLVEITFLYIVKEIQILIKYYSSKTKCPNEASQKKTSNNNEDESFSYPLIVSLSLLSKDEIAYLDISKHCWITIW